MPTTRSLSEQEIRALVLEVMGELNLDRAPDQQMPLDADAPLYGPDSPLDSLDLVELIMEIEDSLGQRGFHVSLSDEKAMSQQHSPFRSVQSLVTYLRQVLSTEPG